VAALFDSAEGKSGVGFDGAVDEDGAGVDAGGEALGERNVVCPDAGAEAIGALVGQFDGVIDVFGLNDGGNGAEGFFVEGGHAGTDVRENGWRIEEAFAGEGMASGDGASAGGDGALNLGFEIVQQIAAGEGADVGGTVHGVADFEGGHCRGKCGGEGLWISDNDEAFGGDAALAGILGAGGGGSFCGGRNVGIG